MLVSVIALLIAMPIALGISIFLTEYAPKRIVGPGDLPGRPAGRGPVDRLRSGGILVLGPALVPVNTWLVDNVGWLPFFQVPQDNITNMSTGGTLLTAGIVLAVMILPIITAVTREVFIQTPVSHREAALGAGRHQMEVVRMAAVLPFGFSGYISGSMRSGSGAHSARRWRPT